jgi:hypothetical protein
MSSLRFSLVALAVQAFACSSAQPTEQPDSAVAEDSAAETGDDTGEIGSGAYPSGPYGLALHQVIPDLEFEGYRDGKPPFTKLHLHDYYDPTGSRGINGLLVQVDSSWSGCGWCKEDGANLVAWNDVVRARGGRLLQVVLPDGSDSPRDDLDSWVVQFKTNFDVVTDPGKTALRPTDMALPKSYVVDPRTMTIVRAQVGVPDPGVMRECKADGDCCQPGGKRPGIDLQGTEGASFCPSQAYVCSTLYPKTCVNPNQMSPLPSLDRLLESRGAPVLVDAGSP